jgi:hypothetical protein
MLVIHVMIDIAKRCSDLKLPDGRIEPVDPDMFQFLVAEHKIASVTGDQFGFYRLK